MKKLHKENNDNPLGYEDFKKVLHYVITNHMVDLRLADEGFKFLEEFEKAVGNPKLKFSTFYKNVYDFLNRGSHCEECEDEKIHDHKKDDEYGTD